MDLQKMVCFYLIRQIENIVITYYSRHLYPCDHGEPQTKARYSKWPTD